MSTDAATYFWITSPEVHQEVQKALDERPIFPPIHPRIKDCTLRVRLHSKDFQKVLMDFAEAHDLSTYFDVNLDEVSDKTLHDIQYIRRCYIQFRNLSLHRSRGLQKRSDKVAIYAQVFKMSFLYRDMAFNSDYFDVHDYRTMIFKLLWCMKKGFLFALILFCELVPEFVTDDCVPKVKMIVGCFGSTINKHAPTHAGVFDDPFYQTLLAKHHDKIHAVIQRNMIETFKQN